MWRRDFLQLAGVSALAACGASSSASSSSSVPVPRTSGGSPLAGGATAAPPARGTVRAVGFDLFTVFDPRGVDHRVADVVRDQPAAFAATWKTRLFEYSWIRAAAGQYAPFDRLADDALDFAARMHRVELTAAARAQLAAAFTELPPWPDSAAVLRELRGRGLRLAPLANFAPAMIDALLRHGGLHDLFDDQISTDAARSYKPDPRAYALAEARFGLPRRDIAFAAFGGWDAAGGAWFGFPTFWVNRLGVAVEALDGPTATGPDLVALAAWLAGRG